MTVRNHRGRVVDTNATRRDTDCIEVVMDFPEFITAFERWLTSRGMYLFPIPVDADHLPAYGIGFIDREGSLMIYKADHQAADRAMNAACKRAVTLIREGRCHTLCADVALQRAQVTLAAAVVTAGLLVDEEA